MPFDRVAILVSSSYRHTSQNHKPKANTPSKKIAASFKASKDTKVRKHAPIVSPFNKRESVKFQCKNSEEAKHRTIAKDPEEVQSGAESREALLKIANRLGHAQRSCEDSSANRIEEVVVCKNLQALEWRTRYAYALLVCFYLFLFKTRLRDVNAKFLA